MNPVTIYFILYFRICHYEYAKYDDDLIDYFISRTLVT